MAVIVTPERNFQHAGNNLLYLNDKDPRGLDFSEEGVVLDLRDCIFIQVPAVLWSVVFLLLANSKVGDCELLVPENMGVCIYLKSTGLFQVLQENGVKVDDRGVGDRAATRLILPLTHFNNEYEVDEVTNRAYDAISASNLGASNLHAIVTETFSELAMNAVQHAESTIGAYGIIQFVQGQSGQQRFVCGVADGGIGIRRSLSRNPAHPKRELWYDWTAIEYAMKERISGTESSLRGMGLFGIMEDAMENNQVLIIHSGIGSLQVNEGSLDSEARRASLFPGTLAYVSIPT